MSASRKRRRDSSPGGRAGGSIDGVGDGGAQGGAIFGGEGGADGGRDGARPDLAPRNDEGGDMNRGGGGGNQGGAINLGGGANQGIFSRDDSRKQDVPTYDKATYDVLQFKEWCNTKLQDATQIPSPEGLEPREKLLKLLCRAPSDNHKKLQRNLPNNLVLESLPHDSNEDDGKYADLANRIRLAEHEGTLTDEAVRALADIPGWIKRSQDDESWDDDEPWGIGDMCFCATCGEAALKDRYTALYTERLERKIPWYDPSDQTRCKELFELIERHWVAFFHPLQELPYKYPDSTGHHPLLHRDGQRISMHREISDLFADDEVPDGPKAEAKRELWDERDGLNLQAYRAIALMNQHRRDQFAFDDIYKKLKRLDPKFKEDKSLNFEGTKEDHYCLGCRPHGFKYYVGVTNNEIRRHDQHAGTLYANKDKGAYFIKFMTCRLNRNRRPDRFGGWKLNEKIRRDKKIAWKVKDDNIWSTEDEDDRVLKLCNTRGLHHVRGGVHVFPKLSETELAQLRSHYRARYDLCSKCGAKGHWASTCPKCGQPANEDPALLAHMNLLVGSDKDVRNDDPFVRAGTVAGAVCESLPVARIVCMSNSAEIDAEPATDKLGDLVDALYGDGASSSLRPLQTQAMRHVFDQNNRPDITLTVPTAYGKTRVYTVAAVHEVIYGAGRAVIFLPYSALMSDIACEFAKLCDGEHDEVVKYQADDRANGTEMPYGGVLHVDLKDDNDEDVRHSITWTIWRGFSGDEHMRMHTMHRIFRNAQIILATPDKWAYPDPRDTDSCDSFISAWGHESAESRKEWVKKLGLVVIDEAHEFKEVMGGQTRELLRRMRTLRDVIKDKNDCRQRVMLVSATIPEPEVFSKKLLGP
jgi:hypothetical protein